MIPSTDLSNILDPAQFAHARSQRLPRRRLGRGITALLVLLRVYVVVAIPIVVYAFVHALGSSTP